MIRRYVILESQSEQGRNLIYVRELKPLEPFMHLPESPDHVRTSYAAAMTLGFETGSFFRGAQLHCINLLLTYKGGCAGACAYCGLNRYRASRNSRGEGTFIRVPWPTFRLDAVIDAMKSGRCQHVERACISMVTNARAVDDLLTVNRRIRAKSNLPLSALIAPSTAIDTPWLRELRGSGTDHVGIAIDAATPAIFERLRGQGVSGPHRWDRYWEIVNAACEVFGHSNVGIHLIVGLGETEKEMGQMFQRCVDLGVAIHLFSYFPEADPGEKGLRQPPIGQFRRMQVLRHLLARGLSQFRKLTFNVAGQLLAYGVPRQVLQDQICTGEPFRTSGCPGHTLPVACNRPYANCTPFQAAMGEFRNFPFALQARDLEVVQRQLWDYRQESIAPTIELADDFIIDEG